MTADFWHYFIEEVRKGPFLETYTPPSSMKHTLILSRSHDTSSNHVSGQKRKKQKHLQQSNTAAAAAAAKLMLRLVLPWCPLDLHERWEMSQRNILSEN